jgi:hypothetical protein
MLIVVRVRSGEAVFLYAAEQGSVDKLNSVLWG